MPARLLPARYRWLLSLIMALGTASTSLTAGANGGHFMVDDASIAPPSNCELETWVTRLDPNTVATAVPTCNFTGASEWSMPVRYNISDSETEAVGLQYKRVLWSTSSGPTLAVSAGTQYSLLSDEFGKFYVNLPLSVQPLENLTVHFNGGLTHDRVLDDTYANWGVAATLKPLTGPVWILEMADNEWRSDPVFAAGARMPIGSTRWTLDLGVARDTQWDETAYTIGINIPNLF
ncbi:hypothetical protein [Marinimicrobium sp. ARAG 43.8]|uniref:hypothetical protein n=1 Tax=Marinimicrobium sp. ARAG 43.8 TaxID=3418719 RepID=UPI003CE75EB9